MMRRLIAALLIVALSATLAPAQEVPDDGSTAVRILVTFPDPGIDRAAPTGPPGPSYRRRSSLYVTSVGVKRAARRIAEDFELQALDEWPIASLKVHCLVYGVADGVEVGELLKRLRARPEVESAQLLNTFELSTSEEYGHNDPYSKLQHVLDTLELPQAHDWSLGDGTDVTIIDTGADFDHPELRTQIANHHNFVTDRHGEFAADSHGTAVAGVIAAAYGNGVGMIGVAPGSRLTVLKACWYAANRSSAICDSFTLAQALSHAIESGTDIINLSLGGPPDALLERLVEEALRRDITVIAAAPSRDASGFPAEVSGVIVVRSLDDFSAQGDWQNRPVNAPGTDILVPTPDGGYDYASGSSLAAAHVTGIVALLLSRRSTLSQSEITTLLITSQLTLTDSVNACRALAELLQQSGCNGHEAVSRRF